MPGESGTLASVREAARADMQDAASVLERLAGTYSPDGLLAAAFVALRVGRPGEYSDALDGSAPAKLELLAFHLWRAPSPGGAPVTLEARREALDAVGRLLISSLLAGRQPRTGRHDPIDAVVDDVLINARVVRGSAYPEQTSTDIIEILGRADPWFAGQIGAGATDLVGLLWSIGCPGGQNGEEGREGGRAENGGSVNWAFMRPMLSLMLPAPVGTLPGWRLSPLTATGSDFTPSRKSPRRCPEWPS